MRAAAQLEAVVVDTDRAHGLAVLLVEERVGSTLHRLGHRHVLDGDGPVLADDAPDLVLDRAQLVGGERAVEREVEAQVVRCHERTRLPGTVPDDIAQRAVQDVRAGVVAHRRRAPDRVHDRLDRLPDPQPAVERAAMDMQAADRLLRVGHGEQLAAPTRFADHALVADLAAALGIERRRVEDDLGLAQPGQLVELDPVTHDRDHATLGRGRLVAEEAGVAGAGLDRLVERAELGLLRELGLLSGAAPLALLGERPVEALAIEPHAVFRGQLDGQVDREAIRVVEPERDVARQDRRVGRAGRRPSGRSPARSSPAAGAPLRAGPSRRRASARTALPRGGAPR